MRKFILVIISMVSIFLTGCVSDPETYYFDAADLIANTIKIELVECKNEKLEMIEVNEKSITNFDYNEVEPIDNLDNSQFESFIIELSIFIKTEMDVGGAMKILLKDDAFQWDSLCR